jgi:hypothetical protein
MKSNNILLLLKEGFGVEPERKRLLSGTRRDFLSSTAMLSGYGMMMANRAAGGRLRLPAVKTIGPENIEDRESAAWPVVEYCSDPGSR